jgi:hypothetical protein
MGDKKYKKGQKSTTEILKESRSVLYGDEVEVSSVLNNVLTLLNRMDTRLSTIEKKTGKDNYPLSGTSTRDYKMYLYKTTCTGNLVLDRGQPYALH